MRRLASRIRRIAVVAAALAACIAQTANGLQAGTTASKMPTSRFAPLLPRQDLTTIPCRGPNGARGGRVAMRSRSTVATSSPLSASSTRAPPRSPSALFSSPDGSQDGSNRGKRGGPKRLAMAFRRSFARLATLPLRLKNRFAGLTRKAKILVVMQLLVFFAIFGSVGHKAYVRSQQNDSAMSRRPPIEVSYSRFLELAEESEAKGSTISMDNVRIGTDRIVYRLTQTPDLDFEDEEPKQLIAYTRKVDASPQLIATLRENKIPFAAIQQRPNVGLAVVRTAFIMFYLLILFRMYKTFSGNAGGGSAGDVPGKLASSKGKDPVPITSFNDIQGIDDAKGEVMELVDALRFPEKYAILGARAPTGLLMEGPPGTGKTMLARATAAAAGVPLLYCSGSDFVEMFVGRGAARVRKLFEKASKLSPCIIFFDELDALGKSRDFGANNFMGNTGRGNDEAEQTLNQLLACMDGLDSSRRICVLAATNRKEVLDPALVRPGRFDRIVKLQLPDAQGRENILRVHASKLPGFEECSGVSAGSFGKDNKVDLSAIAAVTGGLSGAELEFVVNEAAIRAVRRVTASIRAGKKDVTQQVRAEDFESSLRNFFETRKPKNGVDGMWKNVWGQ